MIINSRNINKCKI